MVALLPLSFADLRREWHGTVHAYDASLSGYGVVCHQASTDTVATAGRQRERFRFRDGLACRPRAARIAGEQRAEVELEAEVAALDDSQAEQVGAASGFSEVGPELLETPQWSTVYGGRWRKKGTHFCLGGVGSTMDCETRFEES